MIFSRQETLLKEKNKLQLSYLNSIE